MNHDLEPLETSAWLDQLRKLAMRSARAEEALARSLRRGLHLAELTPRPLRHIVACSATEEQFEHWLESGALLTAALALVGDHLSYNLSHMDSDGKVAAEVWFPDEPEVGSAIEASAALAVFKAWLNCLSALDPRAALGGELPSLPGRRRSQSARRPKLTEH